MNTPHRISWMTLLLPPERYEPVEVCLPDDSVKRGVWTGAQWCADGQQVTPKAWRPFQSVLDYQNELRSA